MGTQINQISSSHDVYIPEEETENEHIFTHTYMQYLVVIRAIKKKKGKGTEQWRKGITI